MSPQRKRRSTSSPSSPLHLHRTKKVKKTKIARFHHYQPLNHLCREIRVLELAPGKPGSRIVARLLTVSLDDNPVYDALSYCWGAPRPSYDIFIDISSHDDDDDDDSNHSREAIDATLLFPVGRNLRKALDDLRHRDKPRLVWTDAICINQQDDLEKSHQIQLMQEIYTRARVVCAWLDHNVQPKGSVFEDLQNLGKGVELNDFHDPSYWYPVADIFRNPYWRRLWIQQELILAGKVDVYCRRDVFPGEQLFEFQRQVNATKLQAMRVDVPEYNLSRYIDENTDLVPLPEVFGGGIVRARINMLEGREAQEVFSASSASSSSSGVKITRAMLASSLINLFLQSAGLKMTDTRDRVYGILGLATDLGNGDIPLEIKYGDASPVWVYAQVFRHFIHRYQSLSFLCFDRNSLKGTTVSRRDFPSWMPHADINWGNVNASRACGGALATLQNTVLDIDALTLKAQGIKVDTVKHIAGNGDDFGWIPIPEWLTQLESFCRKVWPDSDSSPPDDTSPLYEREDVTALVVPWLSAARYKAMWKLDKPDAQRRVHLIRSLLAAARKADQKNLSTGDVLRGGYTPISILPPDARQECLPVHVQIDAMTVFGTEGARVGSTARTNGVRAGDEIWILFGCRMPLAVRTCCKGRELRCEVVGPVILPGVMRGEALESTDDATDALGSQGTTIILE